jgi:hypothetical protein
MPDHRRISSDTGIAESETSVVNMFRLLKVTKTGPPAPEDLFSYRYYSIRDICCHNINMFLDEI